MDKYLSIRQYVVNSPLEPWDGLNKKVKLYLILEKIESLSSKIFFGILSFWNCVREKVKINQQKWINITKKKNKKGEGA